MPFNPLLSRPAQPKTAQLIHGGHKLYDAKQLQFENLIAVPKQAEEAKMSRPQCQAPPDNSFQQVNVFVKGLDPGWTTAELIREFEGRFGEVKSAKVSRNPQTHKSNRYGFVWFAKEESALKAIEECKNGQTYYKVELYQPRVAEGNKEAALLAEAVVKAMLDPEAAAEMKGLTVETEATSTMGIENAIIVSGFDEETKEEELIAYYYRYVYGGGTRNVNDGKVHSCQIFNMPMHHETEIDIPSDSEEEEDEEYLSLGFGSRKKLLSDPLNTTTIASGEHRVAIITFSSEELA